MLSLPKTHAHLAFPDLNPALEPYHSLLEGKLRPAWQLRCHQVVAISRAATHIGGFTPYIPLESGWPRCVVCDNPLSFIWQINFADFDAATFASRGLFQFFYCWFCFPLPDDAYEFGTLCRWYPDFLENEVLTVPQAPCPYLDELSSDLYDLARPSQVDISPFLSFPSVLSFDNPIREDVLHETRHVEGKSLYELYLEIPSFFLNCLSQVGGYPNWVQDRDDTPCCPVCDQRAELVGAIGSDETNLVWGDTGYWYIFACKYTDKCPGLTQPLMASQSL